MPGMDGLKDAAGYVVCSPVTPWYHARQFKRGRAGLNAVYASNQVLVAPLIGSHDC